MMKVKSPKTISLTSDCRDLVQFVVFHENNSTLYVRWRQFLHLSLTNYNDGEQFSVIIARLLAQKSQKDCIVTLTNECLIGSKWPIKGQKNVSSKTPKKELWVPNIFIYNLKTYKVIDVLSKMAGLWIDTDKNVLYSQATHITFICPMRFDKFPLDTQTCRFRVGSYSYDSSKLLFITKNCGYSSKETNSIALDYDIRKFVT